MLQVLVGSTKGHRIAFVFHVLLAHQDLPGSLLEEVHLGTAKVELLIVLSVILAILVDSEISKLFWLVWLWLVILALILLLDCVVLLLRSYIFSDEEVLLVVGHHRHLVMVWMTLPELVLLLL